MTDNEIKREQPSFEVRAESLKKRTKEFFSAYENPNGSEDRLEICLIREGYRAVLMAEEEINRQKAEIDYLRKEYIPMLEKNLRETDKLCMEYMTESAKLQAVIARLNANYEKLLTAKEQLEAETSQEVQSLHREIKTQSNALLAYKEEFERYQSGAYIKLATAEAVKEFANRLKAKALSTKRGGRLGVIDCFDIEKLKKEMVGDS